MSYQRVWSWWNRLHEFSFVDRCVADRYLMNFGRRLSADCFYWLLGSREQVILCCWWMLSRWLFLTIFFCKRCGLLEWWRIWFYRSCWLFYSSKDTLSFICSMRLFRIMFLRVWIIYGISWGVASMCPCQARRSIISRIGSCRYVLRRLALFLGGWGYTWRCWCFREKYCWVEMIRGTCFSLLVASLAYSWWYLHLQWAILLQHWVLIWIFMVIFLWSFLVIEVIF